MKTAKNRWFWPGVSAVLLACLPCAVGLGQERALLAHGAGPTGDGSSPIWVALIGSAEGEGMGTGVFLRETFGTRDWAELPRIPARVTEMTGHGGELVVLLESQLGSARRWAWFSRSRYTFGPALPDGVSEILAVAGNRRSLWALGRVSAPTATTAAATTRPASTGPSRVGLYSLEGIRWVEQPVAWPDGLPLPARQSVSMALVGDRPALAVADGSDSVQILQLREGRWTQTAQIQFPGGLSRHFKLLDLKGEPMLWAEPAAPGGGGGKLWRGTELADLRLHGPSPASGASDLAVAGDDLRLFFIRDGKLLEQRYDLRGVPSDQPAEINPVRPRGGTPMERHWVAIALMAVLLVLVLNALLRQRRTSREDDNPDQE